MNALAIKIILGAVLAGALAWGVAIVNGWRHDSAELELVKPAYEKLVKAQKTANTKVEQRAPVDADDRRQLAVDRQAVENEKAKIARAWAAVRAFKPPENPDATGKCAPAPLTAAYLVCFSAAAAGDAGDVASCETTRSDGALAPGPSQ